MEMSHSVEIPVEVGERGRTVLVVTSDDCVEVVVKWTGVATLGLLMSELDEPEGLGCEVLE